MDLAELVGAAVEVPLAGRVFLVSPRPLRVLGELQGWFKRAVPGPVVRAAEQIEQARRLGIPMSREMRELAMDAAVKAGQSWPPQLGGAAWCEAVDAAGLAHEVIRFALTQHQPDVTAEDCRALADGATASEIAGLLLVLFYGTTAPPKASTPTGPGTTGTDAPDATTGDRSSTP